MKFRNPLPALRLGLAALALLLSIGAPAARSVTLHALFQDKAIVVVDGGRRVLKVGEASPEGVRLVSTDTQSEQAEIEVNGKRETLKLGVVISVFQSAARGSATLYAGSDGHFHAEGQINGVAVRFLVDTGATMVALSSREAQRLGLDYKRSGKPSFAQTASGVVATYNLKLDSVTVGDITLRGVDAGVIEGNYPVEALLGMSFLGRMDMRRTDNRLEMTQNY